MAWWWYFVLIFIVILILEIKRICYWKLRGVPGPIPLPFVGNMLGFMSKSNDRFVMDGVKKYGKIFGYMEFHKPVLVVGDHELLREMVVKDFHVFGNRDCPYSDPVFMQQLPWLRGQRWKIVRNLSTPAFTTGKIQSCVPKMRPALDTLISKLTAHENTEVAVRDFTSAFTVDVIANTGFGIASNSQNDPHDEFYRTTISVTQFEMFRVMASTLLSRRLAKLLKLDLIPENVFQYMRRLMIELYERDVQTKGEAKTLLGYWLKGDKESGEEAHLTVDEIVATGFVFLVAGSETTANLSAICFYVLAMHQDIQKRLFDEITEASSQGKLDSGDFSEMTYLDAFINEVLRRHSPVVYFDRDTAKDHVLEKTGVTIQKGTKIMTAFLAIHLDPVLYPEPMVVRPERFLPENKDSLPEYGFWAFGHGPRSCVGRRFGLMETKVLLTQVLKQFKVVPGPKTAIDPKSIGAFITLEYEPLYVKFQARSE